MTDDSAYQPDDYTPRPQRSALARWSLILGCLFFIPAVGFFALILGIVAIINASGPDADPRDRRMAVAGIVLGAVSVVLTCALIPFIGYMAVQPQLTMAHDAAYVTTCKSNLKQIGLGILMYQADCDYEFPPDLQILHDMGYVRDTSLFVCPSAPADVAPATYDIDGPSSYYYARVTKGKDLKQVVPVMWDRFVHPIGVVNVFYSDGRVLAMMPPEAVAAIEMAAPLYDKEPEMPVTQSEVIPDSGEDE